MELQVFDSEGEMRFRVHATEPVWEELALMPGPVDGEALARRLDDAARRAHAALPEPVPGRYDAVEVELPDGPIVVNARSPAAGQLLRVAELREQVHEALEAGRTLQAIEAPELTRAQFRAAWVIRDAAAPVPKRALPALVEHKLQELRRNTDVESTARSLDGELADWDAPATADAAVADLEALGLVREAADGTVEATETLKLLRI